VKVVGVGEPLWLHAGGTDRETTVADDLRALGKVAHGWVQAGTRRKGLKPKPFPPVLLRILGGLGMEPGELYPTTAALLEELDRVAGQVPADHGAWDRLLAYVADHAGDGVALRQSA
jgi:hypothetical protein